MTSDRVQHYKCLVLGQMLLALVVMHLQHRARYLTLHHDDKDKHL